MRIFSAFAAGLLFGIGLVVSQMIDPAKVIGFLDIAGAWDPSLALVMGAALVVTFIGYTLVFKRGKPLFEPSFQLPTKSAVDRPLLAGSALFGVGWGLSGLCPGPAIAGLSLGQVEIYVFVAAMVAGMLLRDSLKRA